MTRLANRDLVGSPAAASNQERAIDTDHSCSTRDLPACLAVPSGNLRWAAGVHGIVFEGCFTEDYLRRQDWIALLGCIVVRDHVEAFDIRTGEAIARWKRARGLE